MKLQLSHHKINPHFWLFFMGLLLLSSTSRSQVEWTDYPQKLKEADKDKVKFGYLTVPENHQEPESRKIQVAFSILKSKNNSDEAVLYLPGGPGGSFTNNMNNFLAIAPIQKILEHKDIVFLDPRGCGNSKPTLCENLNDTEVAYPAIFGRTESEMEALLVKAVEECRDSLSAANIDPRAYSSVAVAHDIELLRKELGYRQWIIRGHSYGSYYGQALIHHFPGTVKAGILSGLVPKGGIHTRVEFENMTGAIKKVIEACEKDPACSQNYPDLENRFLEVLDSLNKEPIKIEGFSNEPIMVDAQVFVLAIFAMIYTKDGMEVLPMLVEMTEQGNDWIFRPLAQSLLTWPIENDMLKIISMNDRATFAEPAGSHSYEDPFFQAVYQYCYNDFDHKIERIYSEILELTPHPYDTTTTVYQTPVLLFDGFYDPVTPPIFTDQVAGYFPNHISFTVADRGHDASGGFEQIIPAYISNPGVKPDLAELQGSPNFEFAHDIILNSGISSLAMKIATGNYLTTAIILGIVLLLLVIGFLYFPIRFIVKKVGKKPVALPITITLSTWLIAFFSIVFLGVLALAVSDTLSSNMYLLAFGLPGQWWILFIFPWLVLIALLVSLYFYQKYRPIGSGNKIFWSLSWIGGLGLLLFFWVSGVIF